jgi:hypothetical protein
MLRRVFPGRKQNRDLERKKRRSPWSSRWLWLRVSILASVLFLLIAGAAQRHQGAVTPDQALSDGVQWITFHHFVPGIWVSLAILLIVLVNIRSLSLAIIAFRVNSPVEVKPLDNATHNRDLDTHPLDVAFSDYLALSRIYRIPTVPGEQEPDRLIEVLKVPTSAGWTGVLSAAVSYAFPRRAFLVTASLLDRKGAQGCGVSVQVRRFPGLAVHLETQWSSTFERALQRGAYAVAAHITQQTKACRKIPWSEWENRERALPTALFRNYQRAKQMVGERRYDEALALFHSALSHDAGNIGIRYDVGQLYERLELYPDALLTYMELVDEIFPVRRSGSMVQSDRVAAPKWWPRSANRDPFIIRYRYIVALGQGDLLAQDLVDSQSRAPSSSREYEDPPWRTQELSEIARLLSTRLDQLYKEYCKASLWDLIINVNSRREISKFLLKCADREAEMLIRDIGRIRLRPRWLGSRRRSVLTPVATKVAQLTIAYRLEKLDRRATVDELRKMKRKLDNAKYDAEGSRNWLEHYNAACYYAAAIVNDTREIAGNRQYAEEAVAALGRAAHYGGQIEFVRSKKYWLQAGDPDLRGLRYYKCFRAFEARVYGHPLPATARLSRYELYRFLRALLRRAARELEKKWRDRAVQCRLGVSNAEFEDWWRQELRAWGMAIRLGRFYNQWQTRQAALAEIRNWIEAFEPEALPIPYPNIAQGPYPPDTGDYALVDRMLTETEDILTFLGSECGSPMPSADISTGTLYDKTVRWSEYAAECSRLGNMMPYEELMAVCLERAALWASLRQWAQSPGPTYGKIFADTITGHSIPLRDGGSRR